MNSEGAELFRSFWWLIFPVFGMGMGVLGMFQRHARSNQTLDLLKAYVEQGKEPPPEMLAALSRHERDEGRSRYDGWIPFGLFLALTAGFIMLALNQSDDPIGLYFCALVMGGLCVGFFMKAILALGRDKDPRP